MTSTVEAVDLPFTEAIEFFRQKTLHPTQKSAPETSWDEIWNTAHSRAFTVAGATTTALVGDFKAAVDKAIATGTTLAEFRQDFDAIVQKRGWVHNGEPGWRSRVIYETNLSTAYSAGRYAQMTEPETKRVFPFWQYVHSGSAHPRLQHLAWNGLTLSCDDGFWATHYPPNGWHCGCRVRPVTAPGLTRMGKNGPDPAPPLETRPYRRSDGTVEQVPIGVDPGFGYNPGQAWKAGMADVPAGAAQKGASPEPEPAASKPAPVKPFKSPMPKPEEIERENKRLTGDYKEWGGSLSESEATALRAYKAGGYEVMNMVLRKELQSASAQAAVDALRGALSRAPPADRTIRVFRGVPAVVWASWKDAQPGDVVDIDDFTSTSISAGIASRFSGNLAEITIANGSRIGAYVHPYPDVNHVEMEFLLNAGAKLRVTGRRRDGRLKMEAL